MTSEQCVLFDTAFTVGVGFTVTMKLLPDPEQPFAVDATVTVEIICDEVEFAAVYTGIFPFPLVPNPTFTDDVHE